jgi:hypothetical protein
MEQTNVTYTGVACKCLSAIEIQRIATYRTANLTTTHYFRE